MELFDRIFADDQVPYKPAEAVGHVPATVAARLLGLEEFVAHPAEGLSRNRDVWDAVRIEIERDPEAAYQLLSALRLEHSLRAEEVGDGGKTVYWPTEYYQAVLRSAVAAALCEYAEAHARRQRGLPVPPSVFGRAIAFGTGQYRILEDYPFLFVALGREAADRDWYVTINAGGRDVRRVLSASILPLPFKVDNINIHRRLCAPAPPFAVSYTLALASPTRGDAWALEINIAMDGSAVIHEPAAVAHEDVFYATSQCKNRVGDVLVLRKGPYPEEVPETQDYAMAFFSRLSVEIETGGQWAIFHDGRTGYCLAVSETFSVHHARGEHPSIVGLEPGLYAVRPVAYIRRGHGD